MALCALTGYAFAAGAAILPGPALAQISGDAAAARIAKEYDVQVLRVRPGQADGTPVWLVTVMIPGGNSNAAFQVNTLAVNRQTGELVPSYRQGVHGPVEPGGAVSTQAERRPSAMRSGTWR